MGNMQFFFARRDMGVACVWHIDAITYVWHFFAGGGGGEQI